MACYCAKYVSVILWMTCWREQHGCCAKVGGAGGVLGRWWCLRKYQSGELESIVFGTLFLKVFTEMPRKCKIVQIKYEEFRFQVIKIMFRI